MKKHISFFTASSLFTISVFFTFLTLAANAQTIDVFQRGEGGYTCYRIPAITKAKDGSLIAFAEARKNSCSDTGDIDLVMKRSTDDGKNWSDTQLIYDAGENVCGNPVPIVDKKSGKIILVTCFNLGQDKESQIINGTSKEGRKILVFTSTDNGKSWSKPHDITSMVKKDDWTWYATGPCHGIQLQSKPYKGRLVVPANHMVAVSKEYQSHLIYSDDLGETWHIGGITKGHGGNESTVTELKDGTLLYNQRNYNRKAAEARSYVFSKDGGETISDTYYDEALVEPICQGSIITYQPKGKNTSTLFFSNPAMKHERSHITIRQSNDCGKTWFRSFLIQEGPGAYSDLVNLGKHRMGIIYEYGLNEPYEKIGFREVKF